MNKGTLTSPYICLLFINRRTSVRLLCDPLIDANGGQRTLLLLWMSCYFCLCLTPVACPPN